MARTKRGRAHIELPAAIVATGDSACLVLLGDPADPATTEQVHALLAALDAAPPVGLRDLAPAYSSLLVQFDPLVTTRDAVRKAILEALARSAQPHGDAARERRIVSVPVRYGGTDGPDLEEVARLAGLPMEEVVRRHAAADYDVAFLGFLAGFPYLSGLPPELAAPRLPTPRTLVPAGSVAIAGGQTGIYPVASPGGWRLIGRTPLRLFDPAAAPPTLLRPGDQVRFVPIVGDEASETQPSAAHHASLEAPQASGPGLAAEGLPQGGVPWLRVIRPGPLTTVQDAGRWGYARYGVSVSGAADADALRLGNLLLGNPPGAAALEITLGGAVFEILASCVAALTGADCAARVDGRLLSHGVIVELHPGQVVELALARAGMRAYLCVAGAVAVPSLLGSRATDLRAGFGGLEGRALRVGDVLRRDECEPGTRLIAGRRLPPDPFRSATEGGICVLRVLPGPHASSSPDALEALLSGEYRVDPHSDRMGVRLQWKAAREGGQTGAQRPAGGQIVSEGVPRGAIQLPPDGEPILLLAEHQTTGGYLIPAVVIAADHWRVGQLRPGERVRFALAAEEEAIAALRARAAWLAQIAGLAGLDRGATSASGPGVGAADPAVLMRGFAEWDEATDALIAVIDTDAHERPHDGPPGDDE